MKKNAQQISFVAMNFFHFANQSRQEKKTVQILSTSQNKPGRKKKNYYASLIASTPTDVSPPSPIKTQLSISVQDMHKLFLIDLKRAAENYSPSNKKKSRN